MEVSHCEGKVLHGLLVVVHSQLLEVLVEEEGVGCTCTKSGTRLTYWFLVAEFAIFNWKWVSIFPTRQAGARL